jgi:heptosyltransferase-2
MLEGAGRPRLGLLPGAARGPSKQWPREHFLALAHRWIRELQGGVAIFGSSAETELCGELAAAAGRGAISLAARLDIPEWAAALSLCDVVVANDSGGMHVAAAVGAPVVALFGMTDPARTGPLGPRCVVLQESPTRARDIPRGSPEARKWLAAIQPDRVYETAQSLLGG